MEKVASSIFDERRQSAAAGGQDFIGMFSHHGLHACSSAINSIIPPKRLYVV